MNNYIEPISVIILILVSSIISVMVRSASMRGVLYVYSTKKATHHFFRNNSNFKKNFNQVLICILILSLIYLCITSPQGLIFTPVIIFFSIQVNRSIRDIDYLFLILSIVYFLILKTTPYYLIGFHLVIIYLEIINEKNESILKLIGPTSVIFIIAHKLLNESMVSMYADIILTFIIPLVFLIFGSMVNIIPKAKGMKRNSMDLVLVLVAVIIEGAAI